MFTGLVGLGLLLVPLSTYAEEVVVKNDSITSFGQAVIVGDFIAGEHAGVRLTSPCNGTIVAVQILWLEGTPGHGQSLEQAIHIYDGPNFPTPSAQLALLEGPVLTPGYWNEFRYLDETQQFPLNVPVTAGQNFYVTLEFANPTDVGNGGPSVVRDTNDCQSGRNVLYGNLGMGWNWYNFCLLLAGDLAIRAVIDCPGATGACCHANGTCENELEQEDCGAFGDVWSQGLNCTQVTCTARGACCRAGGCLQLVTESTCAGVGGSFAGGGTNCDNQVCVAGACCFVDGECAENFGFQCTGLGGTFGGPGTDCTPNPCPQPEGACCFDEFCIEGQTESACTGALGLWVGAFTDCGPPNPCSIPPECHFVSSDPVGGWIDARVPVNPSPPNNPMGWDAVQITFNAECDAAELTPADFVLTETCVPGACDGVAPSVASVVGAGHLATVGFDRPIDPKAWTTLTLVGGAVSDKVVLGFLPGDSDGSRTANAQDIVQVINRINQAFAGGTPPLYQTDINRSGTIAITDMITLVNLLNGASPYPEAYFGKQLPAMP